MTKYKEKIRAKFEEAKKAAEQDWDCHRWWKDQQRNLTTTPVVKVMEEVQNTRTESKEMEILGGNQREVLKVKAL